MPNRLPTPIEMLRELIAIPSMSSVDARFDCGNRAVVEKIAGWLEDLGFEITLAPLAASSDKLNLIARRGAGEEGLVLAGHTDTVPFDAGAWSTDPFTLTERDGRLYGLGCADMKCFFPLVIEALRGLDPASWTQPLVLVATADEESTMGGARALVASKPRLGRYAVIGEPTGLRPVHRHKGVLMETVRLRGRAGHASNPGLGRNAIDGMHRVLGGLIAWRSQLAARYQDADFEVPGPTLNLGSIHGGDSPNRICASCELQVDLRTVPAMSLEGTRAELRQVVEHALEQSGLGLEFHSTIEGVPAHDTARSARLIGLLESLTGGCAGSVSFATEAPFFSELGIETAILGPGDIAQAHQPDEYVAMDRFEPMIALLRSLVQRLCGPA